MTVPLTDSISKAAELTKRSLFTRFDFSKWLTLGFVVFLAHMAEGGGLNLNPGNFMGKGSSGGPSLPITPETLLREGLGWVNAHLTLVIWIGSSVLLLGVLLSVVILWLTSRGKVIFVESVIWDRYAVSEPWERLRVIAASLFKFRLILGTLAGVLGLALLAGTGWLAYPDFLAEKFGQRAMLAAGIIVAYLFCVGLPLALLGWLVEDFVLPIMYLDNVPFSVAFLTFRREIWPGNASTILLYWLTLVPIAMGAAMIMAVVTLFTCCIGGLPYVSSVLFLPIFVFRRAYSLYVLQGLGKRVFPDSPPPPMLSEPGRFGH